MATAAGGLLMSPLHGSVSSGSLNTPLSLKNIEAKPVPFYMNTYTYTHSCILVYLYHSHCVMPHSISVS